MLILLLLILTVLQRKNNKIWPICIVSFCWSTASMMVTSVLPVYLTEQLHVGYLKIGYLEGIVVFCAFITKVFSGILSDYLHKRHLLILIGSIFGIITKPMLAIANTYSLVFLSRLIDRFGKGIRSAPTDALIADLNSKKLNYAFGLRQAIYVLGAVFGAILSILIMFLVESKYDIIFYIATIPATLAVIILYLFVKDNINRSDINLNPNNLSINNKLVTKQFKFNIMDLKKLPKYYWFILIITFFLMVARFSESFLALKVKQFGWPIFWLPLIIIISDLSHALFAFFTRRSRTKIASEKLLILGLIILIIANINWYLANSNLMLIIAIILTGMHLGLTQGILKTLIAMSSLHINPNINGTAFSLFYLVSGCGVFIGNLIAGLLAETFWLSAIFIGGAVASSIALMLLLGIKFYYFKCIKYN